jgi:hypothetical protein
VETWEYSLVHFLVRVLLSKPWIIIKPYLGGALADPAQQYKSVFGGVKFFEEFPYALPTLVSGGIGLIAAIVCALFLKEVCIDTLYWDGHH